AALRIQARHHMLNDTILASRVHGLNDQQHRPRILCVEFVLQFCHVLDTLLQQLLGILLGFQAVSVVRIEIFQVELLAVLNPIWLRQLARPAHGQTSSAKKESLYHAEGQFMQGWAWGANSRKLRLKSAESRHSTHTQNSPEPCGRVQ